MRTRLSARCEQAVGSTASRAHRVLAAPTALRRPRARLYPESRGPWRHGLRFDASEQQIGQHHGIYEPRAAWTMRAARSRRERSIREGHRIVAAFVARSSLQCGVGKQRAAIAGTKSRANACDRSSHRVENLAVSLRPREQASPLGADTHIAAIAAHTSQQIAFKF